MAHTLLDAVNQVLISVNVISGNTGLLSSLTNSALQHNIDVSVQVINEGIDELYYSQNKSLPLEQKEATITLATGTREYALAADLITLMWPMIDRPNTQYLFEYEEGYNAMLLLDPQQVYTGLPIWGVISPITGLLRVDRAPDAPSNGHVYTYEYERNLALVNVTDPVPFNDATFRAMVPFWKQYYKREMRNEFDEGLARQALGRASRCITEEKMREHYSPRG
jgi:hypothetical protein